MSAIQVTLIVAVVAVAAFLARRHTSPPTSRMDPHKLQLSPIRHSQLPDDLIARVRALEAAFAEVYPSTYEEWIEGFQRDLHPEKEIAVWEHIAAGFTKFVAGRDLPLEARKEAFGILLARSGGTDEVTLYFKLKHLTLDDAKKLVSLYSAPPQPIQVGQR